MFERIKTTFVSMKKRAYNSLSCLNPMKKFLKTISPLTPLVFAAMMLYFNKYMAHGLFGDNDYLNYFAWIFVAFAGVNSLYNISSEKNKYSFARQQVINMFYLISSFILVYFMYNEYLKVIFSNPSVWWNGMKAYMFSGEGIFSKITGVLKFLTVLIPPLASIYKLVAKYNNEPVYEKRTAYYTRQTNYGKLYGRVIDQSQNYLSVDLLTSIIIPSLGIILNLLTGEPNKFTYFSFIGGILTAFSSSLHEKSFIKLMPTVLCIITSVMSLLSVLNGICQPKVAA